ncbi:MAG: hypothetical protein IKC16_00330 [Clostridia bacterium]|nr:hypothetical protein [Clostridia bacterium]
MILIVDDNFERRKDIVIKLRIKNYIVAGVQYDELKMYTKPYMTVYINPTRSFVASLKNDTSTLNVFFCDRASIKLPLWSINKLSLKNIPLEIMKIYDENCTYNLKGKIEIVGYACMQDDVFALGGELIHLSKREVQLIRLFMNNHTKEFMLYDVANYFRILANPEENIRSSITKLNAKAKKVRREKIIIVKNDWCYFNPEIASYVCKDPDIEEREDGRIIIFSLPDRY